MNKQELIAELNGLGVVPVIAIDSAESAVELADALIAGGLPVAEITFRTQAAAEVIATLKRKRPELLIGAGTVLGVENLQKAKDCGAEFAVAPGLNPFVVKRAIDLGIPFIPGVATPSEIEQAFSLGCSVLKFFPAEACGGVKMLRAMAAPYKHTDVRFVPTGGVNSQNLSSYLELSSVLCVGGTWVAKQADIAQGRWSDITSRCRQAVQIVQSLRKL